MKIISTVLLFLGSVQSFAMDCEVTQDKLNKVGSMFIVQIDTKLKQDAAKAQYDAFLAQAKRHYTPLSAPETVSATKDPRAGGFDNNHDSIMQYMLGYLLYKDKNACLSALNVAKWLDAKMATQWDNAHSHRHFSIPILAQALDNPGPILDIWARALGRLQNDKLMLDTYDGNLKSAFVGSTLRPTLRTMGGIGRSINIVKKLKALGQFNYSFIWSEEKLKSKLESRANYFYSTRKVGEDKEPRGWQTEPGAYTNSMPFPLFPYLAQGDYVSIGSHVTPFMYGQIWPREMLMLEQDLYAGSLPSLWNLRVKEIARWISHVGYDSDWGHTLKSIEGLLIPSQPKFISQGVFSNWPRCERAADDSTGCKSYGESFHSIAAMVYFLDARMERKLEALAHFYEDAKAMRTGKVDEALLLLLIKD